jgi:hypothetical protein
MKTFVGKMLTGLLLLFVGCSLAVGQDTYAKKKAEIFPAFKFAEITDPSGEEWKAVFERFVDAGKAQVSANLLVYVYAVKGSPRHSIVPRMAEYADFLKKTTGDSISSWVSPGGYRESYSVELWIYSRHDNSPGATPNEKFDPEKFGEIESVPDDEFIEKVKSFLQKLREEGNSQGYIINYGDQKEVARRELLLRENLSSRGHDMRITLVNGGNIGTPKTVLWLVPPGAENPMP